MSNTITINPAATNTQCGINKMDLLQSKDPDTLKMYRDVFASTEDSYTTVVDNDSVQRIKIAATTLQPNSSQLDILLQIKDAFNEVETKIDPSRLQFNVTKAADDEICINRTSSNGLAKIIINDDGLIVLTFTAFRGINKPDSFIPYTEGVADYEALAYAFFAL